MKLLSVLVLCMCLLTGYDYAAKRYNVFDTSSVKVYSGLIHGKFALGLKSHVVVSEGVYAQNDISLKGVSVGIQVQNVGYMRTIYIFNNNDKGQLKNMAFVDMYQ